MERGVPKMAATAALIAAGVIGSVPAGAANGLRLQPRPVVQQPRKPHLPQHIVVIVQENRTVDNLFLGYPGADTQSWGLNSKNKRVSLVPVSLAANYDVWHTHNSFVTEFNNGAMNGWDLVPIDCKDPKPCAQTPYAYVPRSESKPYWQLASQFAFADHVLQPNEGASFPAHQYLIAGQSGTPMAISENPRPHTGGCDVPGAKVATIDLREPYPGAENDVAFPCENYPTIFDLLQSAGRSWRYYTPTFDNIWAAPIGVYHIFESDTMIRGVITPETQVLKDIKKHRLADVSFVVPRQQFSDHPFGSSKGPDWVGAVADQIGTDPYYWGNTAILITWDDWGGWYDHYPTKHPRTRPNDPYEYGFRVPLIVVSPYARKAGFVSHVERNATSVLTFIESVYGLPSLGQLDAMTDNLADMFDFSRKPLPYHAVDSGRFTADYFLSLPPDATPLDK
jgi:phospholipase C